MHSADYAVERCLSVRQSVCLSHAGILSKRRNWAPHSGTEHLLVYDAPEREVRGCHYELLVHSSIITMSRTVMKSVNAVMTVMNV